MTALATANNMPDSKYTKPVILSRCTLDTKEAQWKRLVKTTYRDPNGVQRTWESAVMQTRPVDSDFDGVSIVATLNKSTGPELVLLKQYRPALDKVVIEIPGGLIDPGESAEQCALRELKEETGFVGEVERISRTLFNSPGFCNNNFKLAYVNVDLSLPENQNPSPELEEEEFIEVFTLPIKSLFSDIKRLEKEGFAIETRVVALAEGLELARKWNLEQHDVCWEIDWVDIGQLSKPRINILDVTKSSSGRHNILFTATEKLYQDLVAVEDFQLCEAQRFA